MAPSLTLHRRASPPHGTADCRAGLTAVLVSQPARALTQKVPFLPNLPLAPLNPPLLPSFCVPSFTNLLSYSQHSPHAPASANLETALNANSEAGEQPEIKPSSPYSDESLTREVCSGAFLVARL